MGDESRRRRGRDVDIPRRHATRLRYASVAALGGIAGRGLGFYWLDPVAGVAVGALVAIQGLKICRTAADELLDAAFDPARVERLRDAVSVVLGDDYPVKSLRARKAGPGVVADLVVGARRPGGDSCRLRWTFRGDESRRRRGWDVDIFRGDESRQRRGCRVNIPRRRVAAPPRLGRGYSVETSRGDAAAGTWIFRGR